MDDDESISLLPVTDSFGRQKRTAAGEGREAAAHWLGWNLGRVWRAEMKTNFSSSMVTAVRVAKHFRGIITGGVDRYELPNLGALNFMLHGALGGGGTLSLKTDAQGKVFSTALLRMEIDVPRRLRV